MTHRAASLSGGRGAPHVGPKSELRQQLEAAVSARALHDAWLVDAWVVDGRHAGTPWWLDAAGHDHRVTLQGFASSDELGRALLSCLEVV